MAGTYWLTILPDTSKLKPAINAAMRGEKITADFGIDEKKARKAGQDAAKAAEEGAKSNSPKVKPEADKPASRKAGEDAAKESSAPVEKKRPKVLPQADLPGSRKAGEEAGAAASGGMLTAVKRLAPMLGGLTLAAGLKTSLTEGMDFTTALNTMGGVLKATDAQLAQVSATARQLGSDASLPGVSALTAAQAMTELAKGGFDVAQSMEAARGTLQLAGAAGIDAAQAATIQADALHTFGLSADQAGYAADVLANVANASTGEVTDFAYGLQMSGAVASQFGMTIDDTAAALGTLANQGIKGSDAGTLIKSALLAITDQGKPAQGAIKQLGLTLYNAEGQFVGMASMMDQLQQAAKRMSPEMYQAATNTLFGSDAARLAGVAAKDGATGFNALKEAVNRQGGAADMAAAKTRGLPGAWANFQNTVDNVKLSIYDLVQGPLTGLLNSLSGLPDFVSRNADAFKIIAGVITTIAIPALVRWIATQAIAIGGSIIGSVTSLIGVWGSMGSAILNAAAAAGTYAVAIARGVATSIVSGFTTMVAAIRNMSIVTKLAAGAQWLLNAALLANPIGLIVAAVVAVGVALWAFFTKTETGRKLWDKIWGGIKTVAGVVFDFLKTAVEFLGEKISWLWNNVAVPAFDAIKNAIQTMWNGAKVVWDAFTTALGFVGDKVTAFKDGLVNAFNAVKSVVETVWGAIGGIIDKIGSGIGKVADFLKGAGGAVLNAVGLGGKASGGLVVNGYAEGGRIVGPGTGTSDSILGLPAMVRVSNGEYVMNAAATQRFLPLLDAMNNGRLPGFAAGGLTPHATQMKNVISQMFGISNIGGYREPDGYNEHSTGNALDVMIPNSQSDDGINLGNSVAAWALKNAKAIGLTGVIWRQTSYGYGNGFDPNGKPMEDRGSPTANHFDHVHLFMNEKPDTSLSLSGAPSMSSLVGASASASGGGTYRAATSSELSASSGRVSSASKAVGQAQQRVDDKTFDRNRAQERLDAARAAGKDTRDAEETLRRADRELADANTDLAEKRSKAAEAEQADTELRTKGKLDTSSSASSSDSGGGKSGGMDGSDLGKTFVSGMLETIGLDGSVFSNPLEWPTIKSAMAGVNWFGKLLSGGDGADTSAGGGVSTVGGFASGAADAVGIGGLLSAIPSGIDAISGQSGSPMLAPGEFNPGVAGATLASTSGGMSAFAPADQQGAGGAPGQVDNSINITGNVGMDPAAVQNTIRTEQASRVRSYTPVRAGI